MRGSCWQRWLALALHHDDPRFLSFFVCGDEVFLFIFVLGATPPPRRHGGWGGFAKAEEASMQKEKRGLYASIDSFIGKVGTDHGSSLTPDKLPSRFLSLGALFY
jgi:hypothetical protein